MKKIISTNPAKNYEIIGELNATPLKEIKNKVDKANSAKKSWGNLGIAKRLIYIKKIYQEFRLRQADIVKLITKEVGTPITECNDEVNWDWGYFNWFIENAKKAIAPEISFEDENSIHKIFYEPTGSVAVITPWNLPFDMFLWGVIPNLLVGNTVVYKAAEECALTGKLIEEIMNKINLPDGVFSVVHGDAVEGKFLTEQPVDLIWFTGSSVVGKQIFLNAEKKFIRSILEMGGSNPVIIFDDAEINDSLLNSILFKRYSFCGQTCDADKRLIIHESKYDEFVSKFKIKVENLIVGLPEDKKTNIGPLVSQKQLSTLESQVKDAVDKGAKIVIGGKKPLGLKGAYYVPTILINISRDMKVWKEEVFGPVLPVVTFSSEEEAVELANDTEYGLGSQIFSSNESKILRVAKKLEAGNVDTNGVGHFKPVNPFGGYKASGIGREHGIHGFRELCKIKTISLKKTT